ncbi:hypothetical protein [Nostoc sp. 106C]|uniref:hypothetical protein n=1 Tax=Nostoc sp. 106C TaxID=1932667 RepID=UPI001AA13F6B|nr:hypothetical protein [Nostoc sp. 106C]
MSKPRYGIWAPVGGNFGPLDTEEEPVDASYERSRSPGDCFGIAIFITYLR